MFKTANPSSRIPVYLQNGTKQNVALNLGVAATFVVYLGVKGWWEDRQLVMKYRNN